VCVRLERLGTPYIYSEAELKRILAAMPAATSTRSGIDADTLRTFVLLTRNSPARTVPHMLAAVPPSDATCLCRGGDRLDLHRVAKVGQAFDQAIFLLVGGTAIEVIGAEVLVHRPILEHVVDRGKN
jgi:hypothetical protein